MQRAHRGTPRMSGAMSASGSSLEPCHCRRDQDPTHPRVVSSACRAECRVSSGPVARDQEIAGARLTLELTPPTPAQPAPRAWSLRLDRFARVGMKDGDEAGAVGVDHPVNVLVVRSPPLHDPQPDGIRVTVRYRLSAKGARHYIGHSFIVAPRLRALRLPARQRRRRSRRSNRSGGHPNVAPVNAHKRAAHRGGSARLRRWSFGR